MSRRRARLGRLALALALGGLCACGDAEEPEEPAPTFRAPEGDIFSVTALGLQIEKPPDWSFLPVTSLREDADEVLLEDAAGLWEHLYKPALTPLVAMARHPEPYEGLNPTVELHAIPIRAEDSAGVARGYLMNARPDLVLKGKAQGRPLPDYRVLGSPVSHEAAGIEGASLEMSYRMPDPGAAAQQAEAARAAGGPPARERWWHGRRGVVFFYVEQIGPDPWPEDLAEDFDRILASLRIEQ